MGDVEYLMVTSILPAGGLAIAVILYLVTQGEPLDKYVALSSTSSA
jgi:hypothetical protein